MNVNEYWLLGGILVGALAYVFIEIIKRKCVHSWEPVGDVVQWVIHPVGGGRDCHERRQTIRCTKCGEMTYRLVA